MNNPQAAEILRSLRSFTFTTRPPHNPGDLRQALELAITALEHQPEPINEDPMGVLSVVFPPKPGQYQGDAIRSLEDMTQRYSPETLADLATLDEAGLRILPVEDKAEAEANKIDPRGCTCPNNGAGDCPWCEAKSIAQAQEPTGYGCPLCGSPVIIMAVEVEAKAYPNGDAEVITEQLEWPDTAPARCDGGCGWRGYSSEAVGLPTPTEVQIPQRNRCC